jgi:hypothetical protein
MSFDYDISPQLGDGQAQCLRGSQINDQFEFCWLHNREISGLGTLQTRATIDAASGQRLRLMASETDR